MTGIDFSLIGEWLCFLLSLIAENRQSREILAAGAGFG
jgi:hypothetical protein